MDWALFLLIPCLLASFWLLLYVVAKLAQYIGAPTCPHCHVRAKYHMTAYYGWYQCPKCSRKARRESSKSSWYIP